MTVKKVGEDPEAVKKITCKNCGSILEYLPKDVKKNDVKDYTGSHEYTYHYLNCPECKEDVCIRRV